MKIIIDGDKPIKEILGSREYDFVTTNDKRAFQLHSLIQRVKVIDFSIVNDIKFINWVLKHTKKDVLVIFPNGKPKGFRKSKDIKIVKGKKEEKLSPFDLKDAVLYNIDREMVYCALEQNKSLLYMVVVALMQCSEYLDSHNRQVLIYIDEFTFLKNTMNTITLLAYAFKPVRKKIPFVWYKKEEQ